MNLKHGVRPFRVASNGNSEAKELSQYHHTGCCRVALFVVAMLEVMVSVVDAQENVTSNENTDELKAIASAWTQNQLALQTWEGKGRRIWKSAGNAENYESIYQIEFSWARQQNRLLYVGTRERFDTSSGEKTADDSRSGMIGGLRTADSYMQVFRSKTETAENKRKMQIIQSPGDERVGWGNIDFNPVVPMQHDRTPVDIELALDIKDYDYAGGVGFEIEREGSLVSFRHTTDKRDVRKTYDLSKGGNPLLYRYVSTEPGAVLTIEITTSYREIGGVWVPSSADYLRRDPTDLYESHVIIWTDRVNESVADDQFSMTRLGFQAGDRVWDKRIKAAYTFQPDPPAKSAVRNSDSGPMGSSGESDPERNTTAETHTIASPGTTLAKAAIDDEQKPDPDVPPVQWWKSRIVIGSLAGSGVLLALILMRASRGRVPYRSGDKS